MSRISNATFAVTNLFDLEGWVAVITGGSTGIGLMIAQAFANNGARVYIIGRRAETLQAVQATWGQSLFHPRGEIIGIRADITNKQDLENTTEEIRKREGKVDVLVNNAGQTRDLEGTAEDLNGAEQVRETLWKQKPEDWEGVYRANVVAHFFTAVAFAPLLSAAARAGHTASVINISSVAGLQKASTHHLIYNCSKAASIQLNNLLAQEFTQSEVNIRVNSIAPGLFPSEMTTGESDDANKSQIPVGRDYAEKHATPAGRPGSEQDMAQTAIFLACNQFIYGQTVVIDGGLMLKVA